MPRVLRIINRFNLGGPTHNAAYLTKYLEPEFETMLVGGMWDESEEGSQHILNDLGIEPVILPEMRRKISIRRDHAAYKRVKQLIKEFKPDIVHTHASKAGAVGRLAAADLGVKAVVHTFHGHVFHSYFGAVKTNLYKNIERYLARHTTRIVAISAKQREELVDEHRICRDDKVTVIPLGFDLRRFDEEREAKRALFRQLYGLREDELAIGIIGRLVPIKDHASFLHAIKRVRAATDKPFRVFIIGDGEERASLETLSARLGLAHSSGPHINGHQFKDVLQGIKHNGTQHDLITFTSWLKEIDVVNAGLDIIALSSLNEGTPVSLIEAQASCRPIASTRVGGIEDVVIPDGTALLSAPSDPQGLAQNLLRLIEDASLRHRMGQNGRAHVMHRFHYDRLVQDTAQLYRSLLS